jgi:hypothetical protein
MVDVAHWHIVSRHQVDEYTGRPALGRRELPPELLGA